MRVAVAADEQIAVAVDTLVEGVHFPSGSDPGDVGYKAVAVNLSDLAAMGARPEALSAALLLSAPDDTRIGAIRRGMAQACRPCRVEAPLPIVEAGHFTACVSVLGVLPRGQALTRAGARPGDRIFVTGVLGDAGLALREHYGGIRLSAGARRRAWTRLRRPTPRVEAGIALRGVASAAIDVSDGLVADLGHLCRASGTGARVGLALLPRSDELRESAGEAESWRLAATGGDDYELCFTVPPGRMELLEERAARLSCRVTEIGRIDSGAGVVCARPDGTLWRPRARDGYRHFEARGSGAGATPEHRA